MPDHININHPEKRGVDSEYYRSRLASEKQAVELKNLRMYYDMLAGDVEAIFTRIDRGDPVELHYADGRVFVVTGKERE